MLVGGLLSPLGVLAGAAAAAGSAIVMGLSCTQARAAEPDPLSSADPLDDVLTSDDNRDNSSDRGITFGARDPDALFTSSTITSSSTSVPWGTAQIHVFASGPGSSGPAVETTEGQGGGFFVVAVANGRTSPFTVSFSWQGGSASDGADYTVTTFNATLTFNFINGATTAGIASLTADADNLAESSHFDVGGNLVRGTEDLWLGTSAPSGPGWQAVQDRAQLIINDDPPVVRITGSGGTSEAGPAATFTVTRTGGNLNEALAVNLEAPTGSAVEGEDYQVLPRSVTIASGQSSASIPLNPINDETPEEYVASGPETLYLKIAQGSSYLLGSDSGEIMDIEDDTHVLTRQDVEFNPAVQAAIDAAWQASNPNGSTQDKVEQGFGVYYSLVSGDLLTITTPRDPSMPDSSLPRHQDVNESNKVLVAIFHTHPFTEAEGFDLGPSAADLQLASTSGLIEFLRAHESYFQKLWTAATG